MNLHDQLKSLFPEHDFKEETNKSEPVLYQKEPLLCKYEKRKGKEFFPIKAMPLKIILETQNLNKKVGQTGLLKKNLVKRKFKNKLKKPLKSSRENHQKEKLQNIEKIKEINISKSLKRR